MTNDRHSMQLHALAVLMAAVAVAGCGGGGSDASPPTASPPPVASPPPPATVAVSGKAVDGALQGATACYDVNDNRACDSGEPTSAATGTDGGFTIDVPSAEAGKHRVIVVVPATAIDADTGAAVGTAFTLVAPASGASGAQSIFVSPLTTLVQQQMDASGQTAVQAADFIQQQAGLAVSPLSDFTATANADTARAAYAARLVQLAQAQQAAVVAGAVGQTDLSGGTVTQADVAKAVATAVLGALPAIGAAAADPALAGVTGTALQTALTSAAASVVAGTGVTSASVVLSVGIDKLPKETATAAPEAGAAMAALQYTDANNWFMRVNQGTALDNTPDANGLLYYYDVRTRMAPYGFQPTVGVAESFATGTTKERAGDLHWNGAAWVACTLGQRNAQTPRDAQGRSSSNYCDNYSKGVTTRAAVDISGQSMATVVADKILPVVGPGTYTGGGGGNGWRLDTALLGAGTFPAGSKLFLQTGVDLENAPAYDVRASNQVTVFSQAVADGGDARLGTVACQNAGTAVATIGLEEMVARMPGRPCIFNKQTIADGSSLDPSEAWGLTSLSMGDVPNYFASLPAGTGNYYTNAGRMRVAFTGPGNATTYYQCLVRRADNSTRNCTVIGSGTYTVSTLGDARVMSFNNVPAPIQRVTFTRLFIERGGKVYYGFKNPVGVEFVNVRLNLAAAQALTFQLGLPRILPADTPKPLTGAKATAMATAKGVWGGSDGTSALILRFGDNGEFLLVEVDPIGAGGRPGLEVGWLDFDPASQSTGRLLAIDTNGEWGTSHPMSSEGIASITATAITTKGGESFGRLNDAGSAIVGMWAVDSVTNLRAPQFVFFANGKVLSIHPYNVGDREPGSACDVARQGPPGVEWADYTFNAATGALRVFNKQIDSNGCGGIFDSSDGAVLNGTANTEANVTVTFSADGKSATVNDGSGPATLFRIAPQ